MSESPLKLHFERLRLSLLAKADEIGLAAHGSILGAARELVIADYLEANLPAVVEFATGEIVAPGGQRSGQMDVIVVPGTAPKFLLNDGWKFIPEKLTHPDRAWITVKDTGACLADLFDFLLKIVQSWAYTQPRTPLSLYYR